MKKRWQDSKENIERVNKKIRGGKGMSINEMPSVITEAEVEKIMENYRRNNGYE